MLIRLRICSAIFMVMMLEVIEMDDLQLQRGLYRLWTYAPEPIRLAGYVVTFRITEYAKNAYVWFKGTYMVINLHNFDIAAAGREISMEDCKFVAERISSELLNRSIQGDKYANVYSFIDKLLELNVADFFRLPDNGVLRRISALASGAGELCKDVIIGNWWDRDKNSVPRLKIAIVQNGHQKFIRWISPPDVIDWWMDDLQGMYELIRRPTFDDVSSDSDNSGQVARPSRWFSTIWVSKLELD